MNKKMNNFNLLKTKLEKTNIRTFLFLYSIFEYTSLRSQFRTANYYDRTKEISSKLWNT